LIETFEVLDREEEHQYESAVPLLIEYTQYERLSYDAVQVECLEVFLFTVSHGRRWKLLPWICSKI